MHGGGGAVGLYGLGANGAGGVSSFTGIGMGGGGGSGGASAADCSKYGAWPGGGSGAAQRRYGSGGGGGGLGYINNQTVIPGNTYTVVVGAGGVKTGDSIGGGNGAVRVIWPASIRSFPSTLTGAL